MEVTEWDLPVHARSRGALRRGPVRIGGSRERFARLCRPDLREASGFPASSDPRPPLGRLEGLAFQPAQRRFLRGTRPSEGQSLSAHQAAEPQGVADRIESNSDKPWACLP